jgi:hypothetical protein
VALPFKPCNRGKKRVPHTVRIAGQQELKMNLEFGNNAGNGKDGKGNKLAVFASVFKSSLVKMVQSVKVAATEYKIGCGKKLIRESVNALFEASSEMTDDVVDVSFDIFNDIMKSPKLPRYVCKIANATSTIKTKFNTDKNLLTALKMHELVGDYNIEKDKSEAYEVTTDDLMEEAKKLVSSGDVDSGIFEYIRKNSRPAPKRCLSVTMTLNLNEYEVEDLLSDIKQGKHHFIKTAMKIPTLSDAEVKKVEKAFDGWKKDDEKDVEW